MVVATAALLAILSDAEGDGWAWDEATPATRGRVFDASGSLLAKVQGNRISSHLFPEKAGAGRCAPTAGESGPSPRL